MSLFLVFRLRLVAVQCTKCHISCSECCKDEEAALDIDADQECMMCREPEPATCCRAMERRASTCAVSAPSPASTAGPCATITRSATRSCGVPVLRLRGGEKALVVVARGRNSCSSSACSLSLWPVRRTKGVERLTKEYKASAFLFVPDADPRGRPSVHRARNRTVASISAAF
jgi:hypothetical protein